MVKYLPASAEDSGDTGSIPGWGRSPGRGNGNPLQYSYVENPHGQRSLVGLHSMVSQRVGHDGATKHSTAHLHGTFRLENECEKGVFHLAD